MQLKAESTYIMRIEKNKYNDKCPPKPTKAMKRKNDMKVKSTRDAVPGCTKANFWEWDIIAPELREWLFPTSHGKWLFANGPGGGEEKARFLMAVSDSYKRKGLPGVVTFIENCNEWFESGYPDDIEPYLRSN